MEAKMNKRIFGNIIIGYLLFAVFSTAAFAQQPDKCSANSESACSEKTACCMLKPDEAQAKAGVLSFDDPEWKCLLCALLKDAAAKNDYVFVIDKAKSLIDYSTKDDIKLRARFTLGSAYCLSGKLDEAKNEFKQILDEHSNTACAKEAGCCIQQMGCSMK